MHFNLKRTCLKTATQPTPNRGKLCKSTQQIGVKNHSLSSLQSEPNRFAEFSVNWKNLLFDFSKTHVNRKTIDLFKSLFEEVELGKAIQSQFRGDAINKTENRAVLHTALRDQTDTPIVVDGEDVKPGIKAVLGRIEKFSNKIRSGAWKGFTGKPIKHVVNIGIGGSDLGPKMVTEALKPYGHTRSAAISILLAM